MRIPVSVPAVPANAEKYVSQVIQKNWVSSLCLDETVNYLGKLEKGFSDFIGTKHAVAVTSGTTALHLAVAAMGIGRTDEVIVPSFTMIATAGCVIHNGARPVFVDARADTWCMDVDLVEAAITPNTKAIIPAHIYGYPVEMDPLLEIADRHGLCVIEDAAEAIGSKYGGKMAGSMGAMACFSFYANKTMTCGEGGMIVTDDTDLARRAAMLKDQAFGEPRFIHHDIGYNFRMNNLTAAYAYASFEELPRYITAKIKNASIYNSLLSDIEGIQLPPESNPAAENTYWMYGILIDENRFGRSKQEVRRLLKSDDGIETRDFFFPLHKQPVMIQRGYASENRHLPVSDRLWNRGLYLPSGVNLQENDIHYICESIRKLRK